MRLNDDMRNCIEMCVDSANICTETISHCLEAGGEHATPEHIHLLTDCASICRTAAGFLLRGSKFHVDACNLCAKVCRECADDCREFGEQWMKECADACARCAESCEGLVGGRGQDRELRRA